MGAPDRRPLKDWFSSVDLPPIEDLKAVEAMLPAVRDSADIAARAAAASR